MSHTKLMLFQSQLVTNNLRKKILYKYFDRFMQRDITQIITLYYYHFKSLKQVGIVKKLEQLTCSTSAYTMRIIHKGQPYNYKEG